MAVLSYTSLYSIVSVYSTVEKYPYFKLRMSWSKHESTSDVAGTAKKHQGIIVKIIERVEQQEGEVTEEPKRSLAQGTAGGFLYLRRCWWYLRTWRLMQPFRIQTNATVSSMMREKKSYYLDVTRSFFSRRWIELDRTRNQNLCRRCQAWVKLQLALHLLFLMILQLYHLPRPVSNSCCLFTQC